MHDESPSPSHTTQHTNYARTESRLPSDFGSEFGVCAHTYTETGKVNKLMRESMGRPTMPGLISQSETDENKWTVLYA